MHNKHCHRPTQAQCWFFSPSLSLSQLSISLFLSLTLSHKNWKRCGTSCVCMWCMCCMRESEWVWSCMLKFPNFYTHCYYSSTYLPAYLPTTTTFSRFCICSRFCLPSFPPFFVAWVWEFEACWDRPRKRDGECGHVVHSKTQPPSGRGGSTSTLSPAVFMTGMGVLACRVEQMREILCLWHALVLAGGDLGPRRVSQTRSRRRIWLNAWHRATTKACSSACVRFERPNATTTTTEGPAIQLPLTQPVPNCMHQYSLSLSFFLSFFMAAAFLSVCTLS